MMAHDDFSVCKALQYIGSIFSETKESKNKQLCQ